MERHKGRPFYRVLAGFGLIVASIRRVDDEFDFDTREHSAVVEVPTADRTIRVLAERHHFVKDTVLNKNWDLSAFDDRAAGTPSSMPRPVYCLLEYFAAGPLFSWSRCS